MIASDVYKIAKALSLKEQERLYYMLGQDIPNKTPIKKKRKKLPDFTVEDGIRYLIDNIM